MTSSTAAKGQLGVAERVVRQLGLEGEVELASLAKQFEEVYRPGSPFPVRLRRGSDALYLLQRLRDEAHRFAITFHRERRGKRMTRSWLDDIPGLGPARKARLVKELGGVNAVRAASLEELLSRSWLPDSVGLAVYEALHSPVRSTRGGGTAAGAARPGAVPARAVQPGARPGGAGPGAMRRGAAPPGVML